MMSDAAMAGIVQGLVPNPWCPHTPTPKQGAYLALDCDEALFGGAAGGGKSDALLMAALQHVHVPNYAAILFRRTYADLALPGALMDRAAAWLAGTAATWNSQAHRWTFPSGATLSFGYLANDRDKYRYQSAEFQMVGFDELTQFPESSYLYLFSRLRRLAGSEVPLRMRAASNPGGEGHDWVKARFVDAESRGDKVFLPAGLSDNPYVDRESYERALWNLPETERKQLLDGLWEAGPAEGAYYDQWMTRATQEGRVARVLYDPALPVHTGWDLGIDDATAIWFAQCLPNGREWRLIDYYEASGEALQHYVNKLQEKGYIYGQHYFPHDIEVREMATGKSRRQVLTELGIRVNVVGQHMVEDGIQRVRDVLPLCWFDAEAAKRGLSCLRNYRKEWDEKRQTWRSQPRHDWASHGADALRYLVMGHRAQAAAAPAKTWVRERSQATKW